MPVWHKKMICCSILHFFTSDLDFLCILWKFCILSWIIFSSLLLALISECICSSNWFANIVCNGVCRNIFLEHGSLCRFLYKNRNPKIRYFILFLKGVWVKVPVRADRCSVRAVGQLCSHWPLDPPEMGTWRSERSLTASFGPAPRQMCCTCIERTSKEQALSLDTPCSRPMWAVGAGGGSSVLTVTVISGHFLEVPSAGETIWPETHHQKQTCLVCRLSLFSLTCDWLHHVQQENVEGRTANKFIATANCSVITLFHEWLLNIHYWQSPHRWSDLSTCRGLWLVAGCY